MKYIYIQPICEVREELLGYLVSRLEGIFGYPCRIALPIRVPEISYSADRDQYNAEVLVERIMEEIPNDAEKLLGMVDVDFSAGYVQPKFGGNKAVFQDSYSPKKEDIKQLIIQLGEQS